MLKVVLDTNIITGAYFRDEEDCAKILYKEYLNEFNTVYSNDTTEEMLAVITNVYMLNNEINMSKKEVIDIFKKILRICRRTYPIEPKSCTDYIKSDTTDNVFVDCAIDGNADCIVTCNLRHFKEIIGKVKNNSNKIVQVYSPDSFLKILNKDNKQEVAVAVAVDRTNKK